MKKMIFILSAFVLVSLLSCEKNPNDSVVPETTDDTIVSDVVPEVTTTEENIESEETDASESTTDSTGPIELPSIKF